MSLPEFVTPVLSIAGPPALVFVIMRCFPHTARAVVLLLAGIVAIVTRDPKRRAACHKVLDTLTRTDKQAAPGEARPMTGGTTARSSGSRRALGMPARAGRAVSRADTPCRVVCTALGAGNGVGSLPVAG